MNKDVFLDILPRVLWGVHLLTIFLVQYYVIQQPFKIQTNLFLVIPSLIIGVIGATYFVWSAVYIIKFRHKFSPTKVYDTGIYAISRHPMYIGIYLMIISFGFLFQSKAALIVTFFFIPLWAIDVWLEEKRMIALFPEAYQAYKKKVGVFFPKRNFLKKS